jgi:hypothetical protein
MGNLKGRYHLGDEGVCGRIILTCILGKQSVSVNWIHMAQDRDLWWAVVNTVMNLGFH